MSFAALGVSPKMVRALSSRGIEEPFAVQTLVLPDALAGRDVLAQSPTGSGKTLAFLLPILQNLHSHDRPQSALILAPTRELASQIVDEGREIAQAHGVRMQAVYGGVGLHAQSQAARKAHVIVATPGRLLDLMERGAVKLNRIQYLVLDEADRMLDMGFRPDVDRIVSTTPGDRQTLFFSATLEGEVGRIADAYTRDPVSHTHRPTNQRKADIEHQFLAVAHEDKLSALEDALLGAERALVFVRTKRGADRLAKRLAARNITADSIHGDKSQGQRERALARFERGKVQTLVATDVAARGIDVDGVTHVVNFDAPEDREGYVHRTGRTARAGARGTAITFVMGDQVRDMGRIAKHLGLEEHFRSAGLALEEPQRGGAPRRNRGGNRRRR